MWEKIIGMFIGLYVVGPNKTIREEVNNTYLSGIASRWNMNMHTVAKYWFYAERMRQGGIFRGKKIVRFLPGFERITLVTLVSSRNGPCMRLSRQLLGRCPYRGFLHLHLWWPLGKLAILAEYSIIATAIQPSHPIWSFSSFLVRTDTSNFILILTAITFHSALIHLFTGSMLVIFNTWILWHWAFRSISVLFRKGRWYVYCPWTMFQSSSRQNRIQQNVHP